jgi:hypothetical protein
LEISFVNYISNPHLGDTFYPEESYVIILTKRAGLHFWGIFFKKATGRPALEQKIIFSTKLQIFA